MGIDNGDSRGILEWLPEKLPFPIVVNIFTQDTSKFAEAHAKLLELGLIPKSYTSIGSRPLESIRSTPNLGWEKENCLILPVPGKEYMAATESVGWGIYRIVFKEGIKDMSNIPGKLHIPDRLPLVDCKYFFTHTPGKDVIDQRVLETDPMGQHIKQLLQILNPSEIVDHNGEPLIIA